MVLPLASAYYLFASTIDSHNEDKVEDYYEVYEDIQALKPLLRKKELYNAETSKKIIDEQANEEVAISLYNKDGYMLYSSETHKQQPIQSSENLYKNLYEIQEGLRSYTYKEPVLENGSVIGIYEITIARGAFVETIAKRGLAVTAIFILSFMIIYVVTAIIVHKRVNKRLTGLMNEMSAFASGYTYPETKTGNDEIGELKRHFYQMREQITEAQAVIKAEQKDKEYMVATISHDLKTPLTSIKAYAEALQHQDTLSEAERQLYRNVILDKSDFMHQMLDDLLTHTLLQSQTYELSTVTVEGEEFFDMIISDYDALVQKRGLELVVENTVTETYEVSPKQLMRVADNMVMNAIQHTPKGGKVWMGTFSDVVHLPSWIFHYVQDTYVFDTTDKMYMIIQNEGTGISEYYKTHLFDPLYQVDQARSKKDAHGTGLGLSIAQQIIEKHGGKIMIYSKENQGACFICTIPKKKEGE